MTNDIKDWSTTPASNDIADPGINWQEGMAPSAVNNSARGMMAAVKTWWDESLGGISAHATDTGVADAYVIAPAPAITAYAAGQAFHFFAVNANTGASTLSVNGLGVKAIQLNGSALTAGDIGAGDLVRVVYDGTQFQLPGLASSLVLNDLTVDTDTLYVDSVNNRVGVGTVSPAGTFQIGGGAIGVPNIAADDLVIDNGGTPAGITILNTSDGAIYFGDAVGSSRGRIIYNNAADKLTFSTTTVSRIAIDTSGLDILSGSIQFNGNMALPINNLTAIVASDLDPSADEILVWDNSASAHKKIGLDDFGIKVVAAGAAQTFALADANTMQESTSATGVTWTIPPNSSVAFAIGTVVQIFQSGAGQVTIAPGAGVTLRAPNGLKTSQLYAVMCLTKVATDIWVAFGDVAA